MCVPCARRSPPPDDQCVHSTISALTLGWDPLWSRLVHTALNGWGFSLRMPKVPVRGCGVVCVGAWSRHGFLAKNHTSTPQTRIVERNGTAGVYERVETAGSPLAPAALSRRHAGVRGSACVRQVNQERGRTRQLDAPTSWWVRGRALVGVSELRGVFARLLPLFTTSRTAALRISRWCSSAVGPAACEQTFHASGDRFHLIAHPLDAEHPAHPPRAESQCPSYSSTKEPQRRSHQVIAPLGAHAVMVIARVLSRSKVDGLLPQNPVCQLENSLSNDHETLNPATKSFTTKVQPQTPIRIPLSPIPTFVSLIAIP